MEKQKADKIITEYLKKIYGFAMKKAFSYEEAEEICSEITAELYSSLLKSDEIYNLDGYVWRICSHCYAKFVSKNRKHEGVSLDNIVIPFSDEYDFGEDDEMQKLRREIAYLSKQRREIVFSYYYLNKSVSEVAREQNIPSGTVKWHLSKARNELKEGFTMERKIGHLGLNPIKARSISHSGTPKKDPNDYLGDELNLNIVYSVYFEPKTRTEIADELGVTPVFIDDRLSFLEQNGYLVRKSGGKYSTYVSFTPRKYSLQQKDITLKKQYEAAKVIVDEYVPKVLEAIKDTEVYLPSGNRQLFEAAACFLAISERCCLDTKIDDSKYYIKDTFGSDYKVYVNVAAEQSDPEYIPTFNENDYNACGSMRRKGWKYDCSTWSTDSRIDSRIGGYRNNYGEDHEFIYEYITGSIKNDAANKEKFDRLRERHFLTDDGRVHVMIVKDDIDRFIYDVLPELNEKIKSKFAKFALDEAEMAANDYPPQMRDLVIKENVEFFIGRTVAIMAMDIMYSGKMFKPLTEDEKVTANYIMFSDVLPK